MDRLRIFRRDRVHKGPEINSVNFVQPGVNAAILNRITGSTPSSIAGAMSGNGQVYLVNPNGIAITPTGTVRAGVVRMWRHLCRKHRVKPADSLV
nr:filamentous hemagglutinin N-terminal domain-containing protein [Martelella limonii]